MSHKSTNTSTRTSRLDKAARTMITQSETPRGEQVQAMFLIAAGLFSVSASISEVALALRVGHETEK